MFFKRQDNCGSSTSSGVVNGAPPTEAIDDEASIGGKYEDLPPVEHGLDDDDDNDDEEGDDTGDDSAAWEAASDTAASSHQMTTRSGCVVRFASEDADASSHQMVTRSGRVSLPRTRQIETMKSTLEIEGSAVERRYLTTMIDLMAMRWLQWPWK